MQPAQLPVLTEVRAPSFLEKYPRYISNRNHAGYNTVTFRVKERLLGNTYEGILNIRQAGRPRAQHGVDVTWWCWGTAGKILCEWLGNKNMRLVQAGICLIGEHKGTIMSDALTL